MRLELDLRGERQGFRLAAEGAFELAGVTALFGPSGAGKSTVLKAIAGFEPDLGRVALDGALWQDRQGRASQRPTPAHKRSVGMVFQDARLFEHLDVRGNLRFAARRADPDGPPIELDQVIDALDLEPLLARRVVGLSGGETQRVAIGRALLARPRLMLMDEPLAALDRSRKAQILQSVAELPKRFGLPVIFVSHLVEEIALIAERLIAMRDGGFIGEGPTAQMLEALDPALTGRFEAGAVLEGSVAGYDEAFAVTEIDIGPARLTLPGQVGAVGERLRLRLRARDVSLSLQPLTGVSIRNQIPAVVVSIHEEAGAHAEVTLDCGGQALQARLTRLAAHELALAPGKPVVALIKSVAFDRRFS